MGEVAIRAEGLSKRYCIGARQQHAHTLREVLADTVTRSVRKAPLGLQGNGSASDRDGPNTAMWALKDVSFEIKRGEVLGIIGRNGAGKSTLLKILSRITEPTSGYAELHGRVGSLLEVGTGFDRELTGRENIFLNGAILGMRTSEIVRKFDEIVEFSGVERFIDTPIKHYSSGMYVRLAFAVAAHLEPEILIVDEVLAVGDASFQNKCLGKMEGVAKEGRTVLFVSHSMAAVSSLCSRALLLSGGRIIGDGPTKEVVADYFSEIYDKTSSVTIKDRVDRGGDGTIQVKQIRVGTRSHPSSGHWICGEAAVVQLDYECRGPQKYSNVEVAIGILRQDNFRLLYLGTKVVRKTLATIEGSGSFLCTIPRLPLEPGRYSIITEIKQNGVISDRVEGAAWIDVGQGDYYGTGVIWPYGGILCDYSWAHSPNGSKV